jgi:hypothetical protein
MWPWRRPHITCCRRRQLRPAGVPLRDPPSGPQPAPGEPGPDTATPAAPERAGENIRPLGDEWQDLFLLVTPRPSSTGKCLYVLIHAVGPPGIYVGRWQDILTLLRPAYPYRGFAWHELPAAFDFWARHQRTHAGGRVPSPPLYIQRGFLVPSRGHA